MRITRAGNAVPSLIFACLTISCIDEPTAPRPSNTRIVSSVAAVPFESIDENHYMLDIAREVPSFAGMYFDETGDLIVALTDVRDLARAEAAIRPRLGTHAAPGRAFVTGGNVRTVARAAKYQFIELAGYKMLLREQVFGIPGVVSLDVKQSENRIRMGIADQSATSDVRSLVRSLGIPEDIVHLWTVSYPQTNSHSVTSAHPNGAVQGGWLIRNDAGGECTLGFAARRVSNADPVFVTNSHCTLSHHDDDGTGFRQPNDTIGFEILDPPAYTCGFVSDPCRASDAALIGATAPIQLGTIVRTTSNSGCEDCSMPLTVEHTNPVLQITSATGLIIENEILHKIGATTGWTYGQVEDECADYENNYGWVVSCSDRVDYSSDGGDSGAAVFSLKGDGTAELRGIHYGRVDFTYNDALMSNFDRVQMDLGGLTVFDPGPPGVTIDGPTEVAPGVYCSWTALPVKGIPPYGYEWWGMFSGYGPTIDGHVQSSGDLHVRITDGLGRQQTSSITVTVQGDPGPIQC